MGNLTAVEIDQLAQRIVELGGNSGVTQRCVPLAAGGLAPDLRVNYEFGLVLGVEEFRQEQLYHLQKDYLHNRALHGYGTVTGLAVGWEPASGGTAGSAGDDIRVTVGAGAGVDQCGRTFLIRNDQCANLRGWLQRNRGSLNLEAGPLSLYVVGTYDECPDALVAIAGQPCATSDQALAASRIRDSFNITLRATPPAMPAWYTIQRLAFLMGKVRIVANLPESASDEAAITARVAVIDDPLALAALDAAVVAGGGVLPPFWQLPGEDIAATLDRVLMPWVMQVRPRLTPTVLDGCGTADPVETGILLGRLDVTILNAEALTFDFETTPPATSLAGRPYLLQSQVIQELLFLGSGSERKPARLFGSLFVQDETTLVAWIHYPDRLAPPDGQDGLGGILDVYVNGERRAGSLSRSDRATGDEPNLFAIEVNGGIPAEARVEARFVLSGWRVERGEGETPLPLPAAVDALDYEFLGRDDDTISLYVFAERLSEVRQLAVPDVRFVEDIPRIRLWFPHDVPINLAQVEEGARPVRVRDQAAGQDMAFTVQATNDARVWFLVPVVASGAARPASLRRLLAALNNGQLLIRFDPRVLNVRAAGAEDEGVPLLLAMMRGQYSYSGFDPQDPDGPVITVPFTPSLAQGGLTEQDVIRIILANRQPVPPSVPLANLQFLATNFENRVVFELWFHLDLEWTGYKARVEDEFRLVVLAEVLDDNGDPALLSSETGELRVEVRRMDKYPNVFRVDVQSDRGSESLQYLRFIFPLREQFIVAIGDNRTGSLEEYAKQAGVRFENQYDVENVTDVPAVVLYGRAVTRQNE